MNHKILIGIISLLVVFVLFGMPPDSAAQDVSDVDTRLWLEDLTCDPASGTGQFSFYIQCRSRTGTSWTVSTWQNCIYFQPPLSAQVTNITFSERYFDAPEYNVNEAIAWSGDVPLFDDIWVRPAYNVIGSAASTPAHDDWWNVVKVTVDFDLTNDVGSVTWLASTGDDLPPNYKIILPNTDEVQADELDELIDVPLNCFGEYHSVGKSEARYDFDAGTYIGSTVDGENINAAPDDPFPEGDGVNISGQAGTTVNFDLGVTIPSGSEAYLMAWVDWDNSNTLDAGEEVWSVPQHITASGTQSYSVDIPGGTAAGNYWIRFRLANSADPANATDPVGYYPVDGEIQDEELLVQTPDEIDIQVSKTVQGGVTDVYVDEHLTYEITATNNGPAAASNVYLYENWLYHMDYHSHSITAPTGATSTYDPGGYEWFIDALGAGESATLEIEVSFNEPGVYTNSAGFDHADQPDTDPTNDIGTAPPVNVAQLEADLEVIKGASPTIMRVGDQTTMTLTCINHGPEDATNITIWDALPGGFTLASQSGDGSFGSNTWTIPSLTAGSTAQIDLVLDAITAGYYTNWAIRQASTPDDPNWRNDRDTETLVVLPQQPIDLAVSKSVSPEYVLVGETATFTVTVSRTSISDQIYDIQVRDILPAGVVLQSANPSQGSYDSDPTSTTFGIWSVGDFTTTGSATLELVVTAGHEGSFANLAALESSDPADGNQQNNSDVAILNVGANETDLTLTKTANPTSVATGEQVVFTLQVSNSATGETVEGVQVTDFPKNGFTYQSHSSSTGHNDFNWNLDQNNWNIGTLTPGESAVIEITVIAPDEEGTYRNCGVISRMSLSDPNAQDNVDCVDITVVDAGDPSFQDTEKTDSWIDNDSDGTISVGDQIDYTIVITNSGPVEATNVVFTDPIPTNTTLIAGSLSSTQGTVTEGDPLQVDIGTMAASATVTVTFSVTVTAVPSNGEISNQGSVDSDETEPEPTDDPDTTQDDDPTVTRAGASFQDTEKTDSWIDNDSDGTISVGDQIDYTIVITNSGGETANNVVFTDEIPANTGLVAGSISTTQGTIVNDEPIMEIDIGTMNAGAVVTITFSVIVAADVAQIENQGEVDSDETDPEPTDDPDTTQDDDPTVTRAGASFQDTEKTDSWIDNDSDGTISVGDQIDYTIVITNSGGETANNVVFTDPIPTNTNVVGGSVTTTQGTVQREDPIEIEIGTMDAGATVTVTFSVTVTANVSQIENQGQVDSDETEPEPTDDPDTTQDDDPTVTRAGASFQDTEKTDSWIDNDSDGTISVGDQIDYTIVITNSGGETANNVVFTDPIPTNTTLIAGSLSSTQGTVTEGDPLQVDIGTMAAGATVTVTFSVTVSATPTSGEISNQGSVDSDETEPEPTDDPDTTQDDDPTVTRAGASFQDTEKTDSWIDNDSDGTISVGDQIDYTIVITNSGGETANNVVFTDEIPANTGLISGSINTSQGTIVNDDPIMEIDIGTMNAGAVVTITFSVIVAADVAQIENQGEVDSDETDPEPTDDPDTTPDDDPTITTGGASFQETEKNDTWTDLDSDGMISVGDQIDYAISIVNSGGEAANNVVFTDDIPNNTSLVAGTITTTQGTIVSQSPTIQIDIGTMAAGATVTVTFSVTVTADVSQIENQGFVDSDETEPEPTDDPDTGQDDDPTVTRGGTGGVIDSMLRLINNDQSEGPGGRGHLTFEVVAWATDGNTYLITLYDPVIEFDSTLPTLNPVFTYSDQYFSNYTGVGNETEDLVAQTITFGYQYNGTGSLLTLDGSEQRILLVQVDYDIAEGETGCIRWAQPHIPNASYEVLGEMNDDLTGVLHDDPNLCPVEYPIELSSFQAQVQGGMVVLNWVTQSETNNLGFYIYRSEVKNGNYQRVNSTMIPGAGNSERINHYTFTDDEIAVGKTYYYKLADVNYNGRQVYHGPISVEISLPDKFSLEQNFPNPFNPETTIRFHLQKNGFCTLSIYNMKGQKVRTLVSQSLNAGSHSVIWDGKDSNGRIQASGIYIYKLKFDDRVESRMMEFIK